MITPIDHYRPKIDPVQLSRGFETTPSTEQMSKRELIVKSALAATLGFLPFLVNQLAMYTFKGLAYIAGLAQKEECGGFPLKQLAARSAREITGIPGMIAASVMIVSAKLFALSQTIVWRHYVKNPSGDGLNTRLAWYGSQTWLYQDLEMIAKAFYAPEKLQSHSQSPDWNLLEWSRVKV